jgi:hypothetical protein
MVSHSVSKIFDLDQIERRGLTLLEISLERGDAHRQVKVSQRQNACPAMKLRHRICPCSIALAV